MQMIFITGSNAGFFNSLLITLQSFAERLPGEMLWVCDFGLSPPQAEFLRQRGQLLERPHTLPETVDVFVCKAAMLRYVQAAEIDLKSKAALVWLDADLTLMDVSLGDFEAVVAVMQAEAAVVAACAEPSGFNMGQMADNLGPPAAIYGIYLNELAIDRAHPYVSTGLLFCTSASVLAGWDTVTTPLAYHPLYEQNMFNVVLACDAVPTVILDCEAWQAQGRSLDRVRIVQPEGAKPQAWIGDKAIKILHTTSSFEGHLLIMPATMQVLAVEMHGLLKLFAPEPLRLVQLSLLASFIHQNRDSLLSFGLCHPAASPITGFHYRVEPPA